MTTYKSLTLKIDEDQGNYAKVLASQMSSTQVRKKGMVDLLGITSVINFFSSMKIKVNLDKSLHKTPLLLEEFQVKDIYYNNHRIDVITLFREKRIRVPKSHSDYEIMGSFYVVVQIGTKLKEAKILGYLKKDDILSSKSDARYFYPSENNLQPIEDLIKTIKAPTPGIMPKGKHLECVSLFLRFLDNELSSSHKKEMVRHILTCESCLKRLEDLIEFERVAKQTRKCPETMDKYYRKVSQAPIKTANKNYPNVVTKKSLGSNTEDIVINPIKIMPSKSSRKSVVIPPERIIRERPPERTIEKTTQIVRKSKVEDVIQKPPAPRSEAARHVDKKSAIDYIFREEKKFEGNENTIFIKAPSFEKKKIIIMLSTIILAVALLLFGIVKKATGMASISDVSNEKVQSGHVNDNLDFDQEYGELALQNLPKNNTYSSGGIDYQMLNTVNGEPIIASISKISWEVPENLADKPSYKNFLQMVGKNIKLNLQNDLLLTNEVAKKNIIKVDIKFSSNGNVDSIKIKEGSGSSQIDNIIKKSVNETLSYMKPPSVGIIGKSSEVTLVIML